ncbi:MAG: AAA family ATPase [Gammaproteobacteria bacterium]|nr:AAA family ATPase [Gammaproteobacteria bacterium]
MNRRTSAAPRKRLPIGIQTFSTLRDEGCYYVDKTPHIERLLDHGSRYFLSRPRRFGKSLLLDTIKALFEGREPLFRGLHIHDRWDWTKRHPVLRLSFGSGSFMEPGYLHGNLMAQLDRVERSAGVSSGYATAPERFGELIELLREQAGERVVILVDEYDKPMLDALGVPEAVRANRDYLRGLYATIKDFDEHVRFALLTGVSKFSKVNVFSGLNNLQDITLDRRHADVCGYTDADLDRVFAPELPGLDRSEVRRWYNGYSWLGDEGVYNPYDILLLFDTREFRAHWFETGTPKFLIDMLIERQVRSVDLDGMIGTEALLSTFDVDHIGIEALLFQTGYLTIKGRDSDGGRTTYRLGYPNHEVRQSLNEHLLNALLPDPSRRLALASPLQRLFATNDFPGLEAAFRSIFAAIPHQWHARNEIANYEGYYASVFHSCLAGHGLDVVAEDSSSRGSADIAVRLAGSAYVFEFKVVADQAEGRAMAQLKDRDYVAKYRLAGAATHLVAVEFSKTTRNIVSFEVESEAP